MNKSTELGSFIISMAEADSVLWLGTFSGIKFFDLRMQRFISKSNLPATLTKKNESITHIYKTASGICGYTLTLTKHCMH
jgi:hypothetical protein